MEYSKKKRKEGGNISYRRKKFLYFVLYIFSTSVDIETVYEREREQIKNNKS